MKYTVLEIFRRYRQGIIFFEQLLFIPTMVMILATRLQHFVCFFVVFVVAGIFYTFIHFLRHKDQSREERLYALIHPNHDQRETVLFLGLTAFLLYAFVNFNFRA
ncbi:hypothetical protein [Enterococcus sp.]|uniref:hypothetical protein n=1 Tax=Enterococcus sp. TaxID=35783 RepID=UPI002FCB7014